MISWKRGTPESSRATASASSRIAGQAAAKRAPAGKKRAIGSTGGPSILRS
jgi:hypothetical protein